MIYTWIFFLNIRFIIFKIILQKLILIHVIYLFIYVHIFVLLKPIFESCLIFLFKSLKHPVISILITIIIFDLISISYESYLLKDLISLWYWRLSQFGEHWMSSWRILFYLFVLSPVIHLLTFQNSFLQILVYLLLSILMMSTKMRTHSKENARSLFNYIFNTISIRYDWPRVYPLVIFTNLITIMHLNFASRMIIRKLEIADHSPTWWRFIVNATLAILAIITKITIFRRTVWSRSSLKWEYIVIVIIWWSFLFFCQLFLFWFVFGFNFKYLLLIYNLTWAVFKLNVILLRGIHKTGVLTLNWTVF